MSRHLSRGEKNIITALARDLARDFLLENDLDVLLVDTMLDGGMGSLLFASAESGRRFGKQIAEGWYVDSDGVPVSVTLNVDQSGKLFEVDSFKVDSSRLRRLPESTNEIRLGQIDTDTDTYAEALSLAEPAAGTFVYPDS